MMAGFSDRHDPEKLRAGMPAPTFEGEYGRAWRIDVASALRKEAVKPEDDATLDSWVIEAPYAHPIWHSYNLILVHLRPMPDGRPTKIYREGATHEFWLYALDPKGDRKLLIDSGIPNKIWLRPMNFAAQLAEANDDEARQKIEDVVHDICDAKINPDTDFRRLWVQRFGDHMGKKEWMTQ